MPEERNEICIAECGDRGDVLTGRPAGDLEPWVESRRTAKFCSASLWKPSMRPTYTDLGGTMSSDGAMSRIMVMGASTFLVGLPFGIVGIVQRNA